MKASDSFKLPLLIEHMAANEGTPSLPPETPFLYDSYQLGFSSSAGLELSVAWSTEIASPYPWALFQIRHSALLKIGNAELPWWIAIQDLKWRLSQCYMKACVVTEFGHREPLAPLSRAWMNSASQKPLHTLIQSLSLPVCLWVIRRAHQKLSVR